MRRVRGVAALSGVLMVTTAVSGCFAEPSPLPTVRDFLVAWQNGNYSGAAKQTNGDRKMVAEALESLPGQLDLAALHLALGHVRKDGDDATAQFEVRIDLGDNGPPWDYGSQMRLHRSGGNWKVVWSPSIIHPKLGKGQRLAVVTETPQRAYIKDSKGRSLTKKTKVEIVGVLPGQLPKPDTTLDRLSKITHLDKDRVLGRVRSAPPQEFLPLVTLQLPEQAGVAAQLLQVPGLQARTRYLQIAPSAAGDVVGQLGPATAVLLQQVGAPYQPGDTIGVSGLQVLDQRRLAGTPTVKVVAQDPSGKGSQVLYELPGALSQPVQTTIDRKVQAAAESALSGLHVPASLAAVHQATGEVLAGADHQTDGKNQAFEGHYPPGMTFSMVTTQALLGYHQKLSAEVPCPPTYKVGDEVFHATGSRGSTFQANFVRSCPTAFASLYRSLAYQDLQTSASRFGIGVPWTLPLPSFSGSVPPPANDADRAAAMVGQGGIEVSPLAMALAAAAMENGTWKPPKLLKDPSAPQPIQPRSPDSDAISALLPLLRSSVKSGPARSANLPNSPVSGVTAVVPYGSGKTVSWFVGFRGNIAFALAVEGKVNASAVAAKFLRGASG
ncbi:penicillin-binding transpeptidase domain-containing protein [Actinomadura sp. DC4]|uniref:penicillin-binding transpeptidase domain-containing protein n=1 Tax=Actinomadura sp. DC4 TaxID=3055069 RepID=UPI0025AEDC89|nr:penicillin-binding transpeptidase domain-containing protein [Actinomadura sp. DC4]MDN3355614.1 penicillin-binding transpeptidase domain-containing protein [Actinomadura sp. DC4]